MQFASGVLPACDNHPVPVHQSRCRDGAMPRDDIDVWRGVLQTFDVTSWSRWPPSGKLST